FTLIHFSRLPVPRAFGHARSRVSTFNRVLARQEKEIIETALEKRYGPVSGPIRRRHETRAARANARFENQAFQNQQISVQGAKGQLILFLLKEKPPDGWSSLSPLTVLTLSKPRLILACIVGIKIDVQARYS